MTKVRLLRSGKTAGKQITTAGINEEVTLAMKAAEPNLSNQHVAEIVAVVCVPAKLLAFIPIWNQLNGVTNNIVPISTALQVWPKVSIAGGALWARIFAIFCIQV